MGIGRIGSGPVITGGVTPRQIGNGGSAERLSRESIIAPDSMVSITGKDGRVNFEIMKGMVTNEMYVGMRENSPRLPEPQFWNNEDKSAEGWGDRPVIGIPEVDVNMAESAFSRWTGLCFSLPAVSELEMARRQAMAEMIVSSDADNWEIGQVTSDFEAERETGDDDIDTTRTRLVYNLSSGEVASWRWGGPETNIGLRFIIRYR